VDGGCLVVEGGLPASPAQIEAPVSGGAWEAEVTLAASLTGGFAMYGFVFGRTAAGDSDYGFVGVRLSNAPEHQTEKVWVGLRQPGGALRRLYGQYDGELPGNGRGPLTLRASGDATDTVRVWIDGVLLLETEVPETAETDGRPTDGRLGLFSERATVCFDDFEVRSP